MITRVSLGGICEAVVHDNREDRSQRARIRDNAPHAHYAVEREDIARELGAFKQVCDDIGEQPNWTVMEPFGGSGWHSALIRALVKPLQQYALDQSEDCVRSIKATVPDIIARTEDSYKLPERCSPAESWHWVHADFNLFTPDRLRDEPETRGLLRWIFARAEQCVTITDTSPYSLGGTMVEQARNGEWIAAFMGWRHVATLCWGPACMHRFRPLDQVFQKLPISKRVSGFDDTDALEVKVLP